MRPLRRCGLRFPSRPKLVTIWRIVFASLLITLRLVPTCLPVLQEFVDALPVSLLEADTTGVGDTISRGERTSLGFGDHNVATYCGRGKGFPSMKKTPMEGRARAENTNHQNQS